MGVWVTYYGRYKYCCTWWVGALLIGGCLDGWVEGLYRTREWIGEAGGVRVLYEYVCTMPAPRAYWPSYHQWRCQATTVEPRFEAQAIKYENPRLIATQQVSQLWLKILFESGRHGAVTLCTVECRVSADAGNVLDRRKLCCYTMRSRGHGTVTLSYLCVNTRSWTCRPRTLRAKCLGCTCGVPWLLRSSGVDVGNCHQRCHWLGHVRPFHMRIIFVNFPVRFWLLFDFDRQMS